MATYTFPYSELRMTFRDFAKAAGVCRVPIPSFRGLDAAAQTSLQTKLNTLVSATAALSIGVLTETSKLYEVIDQAVGVNASSNVGAQRADKWLVRWIDATTGIAYSTEIPCADPSTKSDNSKVINLRTGATPTPPAAWTTFKNAFEAVVLSPDGNAVTVLEAVNVTRRG